MSRKSWKGTDVSHLEAGVLELDQQGLKSEFTGYEATSGPARILGMVDERGVLITHAGAGAELKILVDRTPFYAERGDQERDQGQTVISELFPDAAQRARAIGIFAATFAAGFVIGPIIGGIMLDRFWWGAVFLINAPVIAAFLRLAPILLKEVRGSRPGRIDIPSVALSAGGIFLFVYGVQRAAAQGMGRLNASLIFAGLAVLVVFIRRQVRLETPLLDVALFKGRVFTVAILTGLFSLLVWSAIAYLSMTYLQSVLGYTVLHAALLAVPGAVVLTLSCVLTPVLVERTGARAALILCHSSVAAGMLPLILTDETTGPMLYVASTMITGVGFGISFSLVADTAVGAVPESRAGAAGAIEIGRAHV